MESEIGEPEDLVPAGNQNGPVITGQRGKPGGRCPERNYLLFRSY